MKLAKWLDKHGACSPGVEWCEKNGIDSLGAAWVKCPRGDWMLWMLRQSRRLSRVRSVRLACVFARRALPVFERKCPGDKRPRLAIESAEKYAAEPTKENKLAAASAAYAASAAADAASAAYAAYAADAASAASAVAYTADAASAAAYAAAYAADAASAAEQQWQADHLRSQWPTWEDTGGRDA